MGLALGRLDAARARATESAALLDELGSIEDGEALARLAFVEVMVACGDLPLAQAALARAQERLEVRAAKISDPELRKSFLENVPDHAQTRSFALRAG